MMAKSQVANFYAQKTLLITGATGFVGKALLWKLLTACPDINKIYVLIRPKKGADVKQRLTHLLNSTPFKDLNNNAKQLFDRIVGIESDMAAHNCGLREHDTKTLADSVNIVIHSAASVKFDAPLDENMRDNVYASKHMLELCSQFNHLEAYVHVSTAYSNCHLPQLDERLEPLEKPVDELIAEIEALPRQQLDHPSRELLGGRPNTYTYTKAIAEHLVAKYESKIPVCVVRPSIVIAAAEEPSPGWVDNFNGIGGLGSLAAVGLLRTVDWNYWATSDMVPVDFVASCILCAAYEIGTRSDKSIKFYNIASGSVKPVSWGHFFDLLRSEAIKRPTTKVLRPFIKSPRYKRVNKIEFYLTQIFSELLFAYLVDTLLVILGHKKLLVKITTKMHHGYKILRPFTTHDWLFDSKNVSTLVDSLNEHDKQLFNFDLRKIDWEWQAHVLYEGSVKFLFKEDLNCKDAVARGRNRYLIATICHVLLTSMFLALVISTSYYCCKALINVFVF